MPARKRQTYKKPSRSRTGKKHNIGKGISNFIFSAKFLIILLIVVIAGLIYWFLPEITSWMGSTWTNLLDTFGIGLLLILIAIVLLIWLIAGNKWSAFFKSWNYWFGAISFCFAAWGLIAFFNPSLSGNIGTAIITDSMLIGILRIFGLIFLGIFRVHLPEPCFI